MLLRQELGLLRHRAPSSNWNGTQPRGCSCDCNCACDAARAGIPRPMVDVEAPVAVTWIPFSRRYVISCSVKLMTLQTDLIWHRSVVWAFRRMRQQVAQNNRCVERAEQRAAGIRLCNDGCIRLELRSRAQEPDSIRVRAGALLDLALVSAAAIALA